MARSATTSVGYTDGGRGYNGKDVLDLDPALLPGSPVIDAGDDTGAPDWDQRGPGYPRITADDPVVDIGTFEVQNDAAAPSPLQDGRAEQQIPPALVSGLPLRPDLPTVLSSAAFPSQAPTPGGSRGIAPGPGAVSHPGTFLADPRLASVHRNAPLQTTALWPAPDPPPSLVRDPGFLPQEAGQGMYVSRGLSLVLAGSDRGLRVSSPWLQGSCVRLHGWRFCVRT